MWVDHHGTSNQVYSMRSPGVPGGVVTRLLLLCLLASAILALGLHHHESESPESHCFVCQLAAHLAPLCTFAAAGLLAPPKVEWHLIPSPFRGIASLFFVSCGLRAPPTSL